MGAQIQTINGGSYVFRVQGQTYHITSNLNVLNGEACQYDQLYVIGNTQATETRTITSLNK